MRPCPFWEQPVHPIIITVKGRYEVKFEPVQGSRNVLTCPKCGREIFDPALEMENMAQIVETHRSFKNFPAPEKLGLCRRRLKMSHKLLAAKLGKTAQEVVGYEDGVLATENNTKCTGNY